jgi:hypothetical protein
MLKGLRFLIYTFMDKQLLDALNNLSESLEMIAQALDKKGTSNTTTTNALQSGDFSKQLTEINVSLKSIKSDTTKILAQQNTILSMQKKKENDKKTGLFEESDNPEKEGQIKKGITTILLIAVAVLAIGLAFKIVGKIDFLSVVGLSLAVVLMAIAFEKIAKLNLSTKQAFNTSLVIVMMAVAITMASWIMAFIKPIGFTQLLTAVLIAAMFAVLSNYLENIFIASIIFGKLNVSPFQLVKSLVAISLAITASSFILAFIKPMTLGQSITAILIAAMFAVISFNLHKIALGVVLFQSLNISTFELVKVLVGIALAITASSFILAFIKPMSFGQAITGILIAAMFAVIAFNMDKIAIGVVVFKRTGVKATDLLLVLVGIATAITVSSWVLSYVQPIGFWQFLTVLGIALVFALMSYFMDKLAIGIVVIERFLGPGKVYLIPLVLVALATAIALSSIILQNTVDLPFMLILKILLLGATLAIVTLLMTPAVMLMGKMKITDLALGVVGVILIAGAIAISSHILSLGNYDIYPDWKWSLGVGLSLIAFGGAALVLGALIMETGGLGLAALALGAVAVLLVAGTIVATSHVLGLGKYDKYPDWKWSFGVGLSMTAFGLAMVGLGSFILLSGGLGLAALELGAVAVLLVAGTIVATSYILGLGKYDKFPSYEWSFSVGLSMTAFGLAMGGLGTFILGTLGLGMVALIAGGEAVLLIAKTIVDTSFILRKGNYTGGPTKAWAEGIALALGAFSPVYAMLAANKIMSLFGGGVGPEDFAKAIRTVSIGIVDAATYFAGVKVAFKNGPTKEWAEGVGTAISAFSPVYAALMDTGFFGSNVSAEDMKSAILTISDGIIAAAEKFGTNIAKFDLTKVPSKEWGKNVGASLQAFVPIFEFMKGSGFWKSNKGAVDDMVYGISAISSAIVSVAQLFASVDKKIWNSYPSDAWIKGVNSSVSGFIKIVELAGDVKLNEIIKTNILALSMLGVAKTLAIGNKYFSKTINPKYMSNLLRNFRGFIEITKISGDAEMAQILKTRIVASSMLGVAKTLATGNKYFSKTIDPNYMSNLSKNILDYVNLSNSITGMGMLGGVKSLLGLDPISQAARGMVKIAGAYDKLANALKKFGGALDSIDGTKVNLIRRLTGNLAVLAALNQNSFEDMMQTLEDKASVFSKLLDIEQDEKSKRPSVGDKKEDLVAKKGAVVKPKSKYGDTPQQLDVIIGLLSNINQSTSGVDEYITSKGISTANAQQQNQ